MSLDRLERAVVDHIRSSQRADVFEAIDSVASAYAKQTKTGSNREVVANMIEWARNVLGGDHE